MTLRGFLDACYALLVEDFQRVNPLLDADTVHDKVQHALTGGGAEQAVVVPSKEETARKNESAMAALMGMMSSVKGSPVR
jgi:hypothetical protein